MFPVTFEERLNCTKDLSEEQQSKILPQCFSHYKFETAFYISSCLKVILTFFQYKQPIDRHLE